MPTREEALAELYKRGKLNPKQSAAVEELIRRGKIAPSQEFGAPISTLSMGGDPFQADVAERTPRQQAMAELAQETGFLEALGASVGKGFMTIGRGVGLAEPAGEIEREAFAALRKERPITTTIGEAVGEAAPFVPAAIATGGIAALAPRALATGAVTAAEGGLIAAGRGEDVLTGAGIGGAIGLGAEVLFPVIGKLGRKVFQRMTGKAPAGAMLTPDGLPTPELKEALDTAGMTFKDLSDDAAEVITGAKPGAIPEQVARQAQFAEAGVPLTRGELTQEFGQQAIEQRLLESAEDVAAEPLRQFKFKQSEAIKENLRSNFGFDVEQEETGQLIQDALTGRKKLLRTQKNELYETAAENAKEIGGVPIFTDNISDAMPDADLFEDLAITAPASMKSLDQLLTKYGMKEPTQEMVTAGFAPAPLTINNFERFRKTLGAIERGDQTGAASIAIRPIKEALDAEADELAGTLAAKGISGEIVEPLKQARKAVRRLKTEFSPQSIVGKIIDVKKDGVTQVTEASKIYSKLAANASPVEETRKVIKSLLRGGEKGEQAVASLQTSTMMDLIDAGFGTESRKISGVKVFNPIAFKRRLDKIGQAKLKTIFSNNKDALKKINNIEKIAATLVPPAGAQPKGSASVILDLMNNLGLVSISAKIPGGALMVGAMRKVAQPVKTGLAVGKALKPEPEVLQLRNMFDKNFPGIASAIGVTGVLESQREVENE